MFYLLPSFFIYDQTPASYISFALRLMADVLVWEKRIAICCPYAQTTRRHVGECTVQKYRTFKTVNRFCLAVCICSFWPRSQKLRKATISFVMSVLPFSWNNSAPTGRIFLKFDVWVFCETLLRKPKFH